MKLIIIRHGETIENQTGIIQGQLPGILSPEGKKQAQKLARELKNENIDAIYSSDLNRAKNTTQTIARFHQAPIIFTEMLRDRCLGVFQGKPKQELSQAEKESGLDYFDFIPQEGESYKDFYDRVKFFCNYILLKHPHKTVLISSHTRFIKVMLSIIMNKNLEDAISIKQSNACINIVEIKRKLEYQIQALNYTQHLK